ncbi:hypothetical protein FisN_32Lu025 [Fistulifera solaris]|uniref:Uncharacterized protein n=1 Tax=Fistulifera solaris TaxID=1519565 RepID=A0A1Z5KPN7_FISSO|nr:hypothetical protein FisN_32Lu025 [Fistulifera solaris]|eukprot:GAX27971.1 hypothetical protein FisN_32Lu025 [Fistulifera solaris]
MTSFMSQILEPGGGVMLLPFVRTVIAFLLLLCLTAALFDVARIHMLILSFLSGGLLLSLSFFEQEYKKVRRAANSQAAVAPTTSTSSTSNNKSD